MSWAAGQQPKRSSVSWAGFEVWDIYLGTQAGALVRASSPVVWCQYSSAAAGLNELLTGAATAPRAWFGPRLRLWLSGALARPFVFEPPEGLKDTSELLALARARAAQATGLAQPCEVCLSEPVEGRNQLAVALNGDLHQALLAVVDKTKARLVSVQPWWACAQQVALRVSPKLQAMVLVDTDSVTLLAAKQDEWMAAQSYVPAPVGQQLQALVVRFLLSSESAEPLSTWVSLDAAAAANGSAAWPWAQLQAIGTLE